MSQPLSATLLDADALDRLRELDPSGKSRLLERVLRAFHSSVSAAVESAVVSVAAVSFLVPQAMRSAKNKAARMVWMVFLVMVVSVLWRWAKIRSQDLIYCLSRTRYLRLRSRRRMKRLSMSK